MRAIILLAGCLMVAACSRELKTKINNAVGFDVEVQVLVKGHAYDPEIVKPLDHMDVVEPIEDIISVNYQYNGSKCRIDEVEIRKISYPTRGGIFMGSDHKTVDLRKC
ncbi:hypothetical protein [Rhizorhabdus dicambivorans]|uniref:hypothetical protein n=1 Tax=Rhizorhabdus dicambivorans TaxID=1850238 RepID=UPI00111224A1|nr:hypothetical protein [Rhizorhabdus dicambivorans]